MENKTATCTKCQRQFNIIPAEQEFLQKKGLSLPTWCPGCRQQRRLSLRGQRQLYKAKCGKCGADIVTSFDPKTTKQPIYCRRDYEQYFVENDTIVSDPLPE
jgi:CxxC-x17-CxxC domain-containing protein